jgi:anthranilate phosphoribosyltransferase
VYGEAGKSVESALAAGIARAAEAVDRGAAANLLDRWTVVAGS